MADGGASDRVQQVVQAANQLVPLANNYPVAFALLAVILFAGGCVWIFYRRDKDRGVELTSMVEVNRDQAATMESMATLLEVLPTVLSYLATMAQVLKINGDELQRAIDAARAATEELNGRKRGRRQTGPVVARAPDDAVDSRTTQPSAIAAAGGKGPT